MNRSVRENKSKKRHKEEAANILATWERIKPENKRITSCLPVLQMALMCAGCSGSWNTMTLPSWPCSDVGLPHSLSCVPAEISLVTDSVFPPSSPPHACGDRMPLNEERAEGVAAEEKGGSGICEGGGVVVRWPAEPMQQEMNGCRRRTKKIHNHLKQNHIHNL